MKEDKIEVTLNKLEDEVLKKLKDSKISTNEKIRLLEELDKKITKMLKKNY